MLTTNPLQNNRIVFLDYLRVLACFMVIMVHACEFFYVGANGCSIANDTDRFWVSLIDSALRAAVPLFVMTSSYLLLPLKESGAPFFKRRFSRVLIPFIIWSVLYATVPVLYGDMTKEDMKGSLTRLLLNFNMSSGHLWFIYMLIGLYMFMPILSPWLKQASKRGEQAVLAVWAFTTLHHYIPTYTDGWYGECFWNEFHMFWYFSGYIGYLVLAHYIRTYINWSLQKSMLIGIISFLIGYGLAFFSFYNRTLESIDLGYIEVSWRFCTPPVTLMTFGIFIILKQISFDKEWLYKPIRTISQLSYGIYLMHIFILNFFYKLIHESCTTPVSILLIGIFTFITCCIVSKLLSYIPGNKYILG